MYMLESFNILREKKKKDCSQTYSNVDYCYKNTHFLIGFLFKAFCWVLEHSPNVFKVLILSHN